MPEPLTKQEVDSKTDPSVAKQWDEDTPVEKRFDDFYGIADKLKVCLLGTARPGVGPVHRSMAIAKRSGPDFLFLANAHSQKFKDLQNSSVVSLAFHDSSSMDWISVTGKATTVDNSDSRIKEVWSRASSVWFGDLGDGVHDGSPTDPRLSLIEVQPSYISYWKAKTGAVGFAKEVVGSMITGGVPDTGYLRQMTEAEIGAARKRDSPMTQ